ncbi:LPXTG cell wall anchor domain-containing protein [Lentilactobacillus kosonis]|uniref:Gram-positive cocci surface proteins LPxTG domain-containing protein n=1 Tax=Lentilactobacillus kosonis TaxID=2810561 RepID=A0A401FQA0_9LACO|nr:hypothetical protein NBRC111893_2557 [Lentilactobacillus kosonis]
MTPPTTPVTNKPNIPFKPSNNKVTKVNISKPKVVTTQNTGKEQPKLKQIVKAGFANKLPQTGDSKANTTTLMAIGTGLLIATLGLAYRAFKRI